MEGEVQQATRGGCCLKDNAGRGSRTTRAGLFFEESGGRGKNNPRHLYRRGMVTEQECDVFAMMSSVQLRELHELGSGLCTVTRGKVVAAIFTSSQ